MLEPPHLMYQLYTLTRDQVTNPVPEKKAFFSNYSTRKSGASRSSPAPKRVAYSIPFLIEKTSNSFYACRFTSPLIQLLFDHVQCSEKTSRCNGRTEQQNPKRVPSDHMTPWGVGAFNLEFRRLFLQLLRYPRHPNKGENEQSRDTEKISLPVRSAAETWTSRYYRAALAASTKHIPNGFFL